MKIMIDLQPLQTNDSRHRGIGNYTRHQLNELIQLNNSHELQFLSYDKNGALGLIEAPLTSYYYGSYGHNQLLLESDVRNTLVSTLMKRTINNINPDLIHFTSPFDSYNIFDINWYNVPKVATVFDLIPLIYKDFYLSDRSFKNKYMERIAFVKKMDRLMAISTSVKEDIIKLLDYDPDRIDVIFGGVDSQYKKMQLSSDETNRVKRKYKITSDFIMCTGGADFRKNLEGLVEAFSYMSAENVSSHQLVIVCRMDIHYRERLHNIAKKMGISDKLILTDFVPHDDLLVLYGMAKGFAFLSYYEGFGLPVLEAMACGVPVVASDTSSIPEVAGDAALLVDPKDLRKVAEKFDLILSNEELRQSLIEKGYIQAKKFTWKRVSELTMDCYEKTFTTDKRNIIQKKEHSNLQYRLAYFTPLPPVESGISDYSFELLPHLKQKFLQIDVFIDQYKPENSFNMENLDIHTSDKFELMNEVNKYDMIIYQIGNSTYHKYMLDVMKKHPGIVVMHEANLHGLLNAITIGSGNANEYIKECILNLGEPGLIEGQNATTGKNYPKVYDIILNKSVLMSGTGYIVHNTYSKQLLEQSMNFALVNVVPMGIQPKLNLSQKGKDELYNKYSLNTNDFIVGIFGHCSRTKRIFEILEAIHILIHQKDVKVKLVIAGELGVDIADEFWEKTKKLKLVDHISYTGRIAMSEFEDLMEIVDISLNLRYPTSGETSATLMRLMGIGKPVFISNVGSFAEIPDDCCIKISVNPIEERAALINGIISLTSKPEEVNRIGRLAADYVRKHHNFELAADKYYDTVKTIINNNEIFTDEQALQEGTRILLNDLQNRGVNSNSLELVDYAEILFRAT